jgi:hypothetical protein
VRRRPSRPRTQERISIIERFEAFAARKTGEAEAATLHPFVTQIDRPPEHVVVVGNRWSRELFDGDFYLSSTRSAHRPSCSLVFVQSADGNTGASDPGTLGAGETDKHLIYEGLSRVAADAVLAGAETIRGGDLVFSVWHPRLIDLRAALRLPRHPAQIVATLKGLDLEHALLFNLPDIPVFLLTIDAVARTMRAALEARPWITAIVMEAPGDLPHAFEQLR